MKTANEQLSYGADHAEVFGVAHIYASFNDTFVHITDLSGKETVARITGGMKVKASRDESSPYAAMLAAQDAAELCKSRGITNLHVRIRGTGGNRPGTIGPGAQSALRALARSSMKIGKIEDVTPVATDSTRRKGGSPRTSPLISRTKWRATMKVPSVIRRYKNGVNDATNTKRRTFVE